MAAFGSAFDSVAFDSNAGVRLGVRIQVCAFGAPSLPILLQSYPAALLAGDQTLADLSGLSAEWRPRVLLAGVDMADQVIGQVEVVAEEGAARIATLIIAPPPGTPLDLPGWTGKPLSIDFCGVVGGQAAYPLRLFTGVVELPSLDVVTGQVKITATDDLQAACGAMTDDAIDALVGGRWSPAVFDAAKSTGWQRVQDRLSTLAASLDLDCWRRPRLTAWASQVADVSFDEDQIEDGSLAVDLAERSALVNRVDIEFTYRFPLLCRTGWPVNIDFIEMSGAAGFADFVDESRVPLARESVLSAVKSAGAYFADLTWAALPTVPVIIGGGFWIPNPATDPQLCLGFSGTLCFDFSRTRDEISQIRVECAASVAAVGVHASSMTGALQNDQFDGAAWEQQRWQLATGDNTAFMPADPPALVIGRIAATPAPATTANDRAAATAAIETLIDIAKADIIASHRHNRVSFTVPLNAGLDLDRVVQVATGKVSATGKVQSVTHLMDTDSGRAVTQVSLAISSLSGVGFAHPDTPTAAETAAIVPAEYSLAPVVAYDSLIGDSTFSITFPGLTDAERGTEVVEIASTINAAIAENEFTLTA